MPQEAQRGSSSSLTSSVSELIVGTLEQQLLELDVGISSRELQEAIAASYRRSVVW